MLAMDFQVVLELAGSIEPISRTLNSCSHLLNPIPIFVKISRCGSKSLLSTGFEFTLSVRIFQRGLAEEGRSSPNIGSTIPVLFHYLVHIGLWTKSKKKKEES